MEITCPKMSMWMALITQLLLFCSMDNSTASHVKSIQIGRAFYPKQKNEDDNKVKVEDLVHKRSDGNTDQNKHSHNLLLIDVSSLGNIDNKKAGFNSKPKVLEIDTSVLSIPVHSTFPEQKSLNTQHEIFPSNFDPDYQLFENEQYDRQNDETNEIFPLSLDHFNNVHTYQPATGSFSVRRSSHANALPFGFPYIHSNYKDTSSESSQKIPLPNINLWPLEEGIGTSSNHKLPKLLSTFKRNVLQKKSPYY